MGPTIGFGDPGDAETAQDVVRPPSNGVRALLTAGKPKKEWHFFVTDTDRGIAPDYLNGVLGFCMCVYLCGWHSLAGFKCTGL